MAKSSRSPDYIRISTFLFLDEYGKEVNKVKGMTFNRFMTQLNYSLQSEKNTDIRLPHCWYRWGDEVVRDHLGSYTKWNH